MLRSTERPFRDLHSPHDFKNYSHPMVCEFYLSTITLCNVPHCCKVLQHVGKTEFDTTTVYGQTSCTLAERSPLVGAFCCVLFFVLTIDECRQLLQKPNLSDEEVKQYRDEMYSLVHRFLDTYLSKSSPKTCKKQ